MKKSFTMLELIFVIVIIGILASIALPKLWVNRDDAIIVKIKTEVSNIRASISNAYSKNIISGVNSCPSLEKSTTDNTLFEKILTYPIYKNSGSIKWDGNGTEYNVTYNGKTIYFNYINDPSKNCKFECNTTLSTSPGFNCSLFR